MTPKLLVMYPVPPGISPGDKLEVVMNKFCNYFSCPEDASAGQGIKIQLLDGAATLLDDDLVVVQHTHLISFSLLVLFQCWLFLKCCTP
jgi:hypothetical protein